MHQLFTVRTTRVILAEDLHEARRLAQSADNPDDVESVEPIQALSDIPQGWQDAIPYGAEQQTTLQCLITGLAADSCIDGFEVHPCRVIGEDEQGRAILEQCDEDSPDISAWSVYGHLKTGGLECLADFENRLQAESLRDQIVTLQSQWAEAEEHFGASGTRPVFSEDEHLEAWFEDRVSGGDLYGGQPLAEDW